jgi:hypothetical protein
VAILHANGFFTRDERGDIGNYFVIIVGREIAARRVNAHIRCIHIMAEFAGIKNRKGNTKPPVHLPVFRSDIICKKMGKGGTERREMESRVYVHTRARPGRKYGNAIADKVKILDSALAIIHYLIANYTIPRV